MLKSNASIIWPQAKFFALLVNLLGPDLVTADWSQFRRFSGLKCRLKLVGMFNTFIRTNFDVLRTFENFDLWGLVLTEGVTCRKKKNYKIK